MKYHPMHEVIVDAPIEKVWQLLIDFDSYSNWSSMVSFRGQPEVGKTVPLMVSILGRKIKTPVEFLKIEENKELAWRGGLSGLITGEHYFELSSIDDDKTKLVQGEKFKGLLLPFMWPILKNTLNKLYEQSNNDIKNYFIK